MSGSPGLNLRRIQTAMKVASGRDVPALDLTAALLGQMGDTTKIVFDRTSLKVHHSRLLNWQIADSLLATTIAQSPERPPQAEIIALHATYCTQAEAAGLIPMAPATFLLRSYSMPTPEVRPRRRPTDAACG